MDGLSFWFGGSGGDDKKLGQTAEVLNKTSMSERASKSTIPGPQRRSTHKNRVLTELHEREGVVAVYRRPLWEPSGDCPSILQFLGFFFVEELSSKIGNFSETKEHMTGILGQRQRSKRVHCKYLLGTNIKCHLRRAYYTKGAFLDRDDQTDPYEGKVKTLRIDLSSSVAKSRMRIPLDVILEEGKRLAFLASPLFQGSRENYVFRTGDSGTGYYFDSNRPPFLSAAFEVEKKKDYEYKQGKEGWGY